MYQELSRLLAGDLDAPSEAALRARIAADPAHSRAWAEMSALPGLLGGLSLDAPPPALTARLSRMTLDAPDLDGAFAAAFPDADLLRPSHPIRSRALARAPSSTSGRAAFLDRLLTEARPVAAPARSVATPSRTGATARRVGVLAAVAACALAAGVLLGQQAATGTAAPGRASVALTEGSTTIDGAADVRAGDVHVRVDGRARVTVTDADPAAPGAPTVVVIAARSEAPVSVAAPLAAAPTAARVSEAFPAAPAALAARATPALHAAPARTVTIAVARGAAVVATVGGPVTVAAGQARRFDAAGAEVAAPEAVAASPSLASPSVVPDAEPGTGRPDEHATLDDEERLEAALDAVPGVDLFDIDCVGGPCVAIFDYDGADPDWREQLGAALAEALDVQVTLTSGDADGLGLVAVSIDADHPARVRTDERAARAGKALDKLERELTE